VHGGRESEEAPMADLAVTTRARAREGRQWRRVFLGGLLLWTASVLVTFWTANPNLGADRYPARQLPGPGHLRRLRPRHHSDKVLTGQRIFTTFLYGGVLGASILEAEFLGQPSLLTYLGIGC
jgi:protease PrsW